MKKKTKTKGFKTRKRYRLTFTNENTFNSVWSVKLSRVKVWVLSAVCCAAIAALAVGIFAWSPLKNFLPGYIKDSERRTIVDNTLKVEEMLAQTNVNQQYINNITDILTSVSDSVSTLRAANPAPEVIADTLMTATDNERAFVAEWMDRERGNLSVLTPIVAEGMMFRLPARSATILPDGNGMQTPAGATVWAIQEATVVSATVNPATGGITMVLQHNNDFVSVVGELKGAFVSVGQHVSAGQALGAIGPDGQLPLSVWHQGRRVPLETLLPQS